nr:MAG TPA: hypothetical protein [Caudoviricetes sp.]
MNKGWGQPLPRPEARSEGIVSCSLYGFVTFTFLAL